MYDTDPKKLENLMALGAAARHSVAEAVSDADLIMTSLPGPKQIASVAFDSGGIFENVTAGAGWIDLSTNNLATCGKIVSEAQKRKIEFLDSPVSGGDEGARAGDLTLMVGGDSELFEKYLPVLKIIGDDISLLGENGAGYAAKISQVILCYLHSIALSEALMLGVKGGVNPDKMLDIIRHSTGRSYVADRYGPCILNGDYDPSFTLGLAHKDMLLAQEMAAGLEIELPMCDLTMNTYSRAMEKYGFDANHLEVVKLLEDDHHMPLRSTK